MNSSPLNPDAPVFVPGSVVGVDKVLAESPRKPLPMDDVDLVDVAQFETGAIVRPAELLDLDNSDQLNGHHNVSIEESIKGQINGNDKCDMDSLGFGFNVDIEPDKVKDMSIIQNFERIQKDTTDFCDVQVFQTHDETNPFADEGHDELFERLKNKEKDPMSMSFYQEKDDDTCDRLSKNELHVDLNAVQPLPDSDDEDLQENDIYENIGKSEKENLSPEQCTALYKNEEGIQEPNNDIILNNRTDIITNNACNISLEDNIIDYDMVNSSNTQYFPNIDFGTNNISEDIVLQTDTPESHKLLFEQIPEIPDGKSSELGYANDDIKDPLESKNNDSESQEKKKEDIEIEGTDYLPKLREEHIDREQVPSPETNKHLGYEETYDIPVSESPIDVGQVTTPVPIIPPEIQSQEAITPEPTHDMHENVTVEIHQQLETNNVATDLERSKDAPEIENNSDHFTPEAAVITEDELIADASLPLDSPIPPHSPLPAELSLPSESPVPPEAMIAESPAPSQSPLVCESPIENDIISTEHSKSPVPSPTSQLSVIRESSPPKDILKSRELTLPTESTALYDTMVHSDSPQTDISQVTEEPGLNIESFATTQSPVPSETHYIANSPITGNISVEPETEKMSDEIVTAESVSHEEILTVTEPRTHSPLPAEVPLPRESPILGESPMPIESPVPIESPMPIESPVPIDSSLPIESPLPTESLPADSSLLTKFPHPTQSPLPEDSFVSDEIVVETQSPIPNEPKLPAESAVISKSPEFVEDITTNVSPNPIESEELISKSSVPIESSVTVEAIPSTELAALEEALVMTESPVPNKSPLPSDSCLRTETPLQIDSPISSDSPLPTDLVETASMSLKLESLPVTETLSDLAHLEESTFRAKSPLHIENNKPSESPIPLETVAIETHFHAQSSFSAAMMPEESIAESMVKTMEEVQIISPAPVEHTELTIANDSLQEVPVMPSETIMHYDDTLPTEIAEEALPCSPAGGPAPDVVPDERVDHTHATRIELVTDIDIGIPESRAQEICVPVTSEIRLDDAVQPPVVTTPPPTPAVEPVEVPFSDVPLAAEIDPNIGTTVVAAATAAAAASAGVAAAITKSKTIGSAKKSPTTPTAKLDTKTSKTTPKSATTGRTLGAAGASKKKIEAPRSASTTPRLTAAKPATPASKSSTPITKSATPTAKSTMPATKSTTTAPKPSSPLKSTIAATKTTTTVTKATTLSAKAPTSRSTATKPSTQPVKTTVRDTTTTSKAPTTTRTLLSKSAPKPAPAAAPRAALPAKPKPKSTEKPLPNGDVNEAKPTARPAPRPAVAPVRPAPRAAPKPAAPQPPKSGVLKLAPRAPLDKQSKDLANKRLTAKAAPPRTAPAKTGPVKSATTKSVPKKPSEAVKKEQAVKDSLANGDAEQPVKTPPSPPAADNALLPDVIA